MSESMTVTSTQAAPPPFNLCATVATQAACLAAVLIASEHNLKFWLAARTLVAPPRPATSASKAADDSTWARARRAGVFLCLVAVEVGAILALSRASVPWVLDGFWCVLIGLVAATSIRRSISILRPAERAVRLKYNDGGQLGLDVVEAGETEGKDDAAADPASVRSKRRRDRLRNAASIIGAIAVLTAAYAEQVAVAKPVLTGTFLLSMLASYFPRISVRAILKVAAGMELGVPSLIGIIMLVVQAVQAIKGPGASDAVADAPSNFAQPDPWVLGMMQFGTDGSPFMLPGVILAITARFEQSLSLASAADEPAGPLAPGAPAPVPRRAPVFRKPLTAAGTVALALVVVVIDVAALYVPSLAAPCAVSNAVFFGGLPAVVGAVAAAAARRGQLRAWYAYAETYVPKTPAADDEETAIQEVDAALDEKKPLLVDYE
ncbi:hypothetical protein Q5752_002553 [Cryptotrichosporon argae]